MSSRFTRVVRRNVLITRTSTAFAVAVALLVVAGCNSSAGTSTSGAGNATGPATADPGFYKGKTITWVISQAVSDASYIGATILAPIVEKELGAHINIVVNAAGGGIAGQDQAAAAKADGLTIGTMSVSGIVADQATGTPTVNFDMQKQSLIAGIPINPQMFLIAPNSPYKTWDALVKSKAHTSATTYRGTVDILEKSMFGAYGINAKLISGYSSVPARTAGYLRGDAQITDGGIADLLPIVTGGKGTPILVTRNLVKGQPGYGVAALNGVPSIADYFSQNPPDTEQKKQAVQAMEALFGSQALNQLFFCPPGTPKPRLLALQDAFKTAINDPATVKAFIASKISPGYDSPASSAADIDQLLELSGVMKAATKGLN